MSKQPDVASFSQWLSDSRDIVSKTLTKSFVDGKLPNAILNKYRTRKTNKKTRPVTPSAGICPITKKSVPIKLAKVDIKLPIDNVECLMQPYDLDTIRNCLEACGIIEGIVKLELHEVLEAGEERIQLALCELLLNMSHLDIVKDIEYTFLGSDIEDNLYFNVSCSTDPEKISESVYKYS